MYSESPKNEESSEFPPMVQAAITTLANAVVDMTSSWKEGIEKRDRHWEERMDRMESLQEKRDRHWEERMDRMESLQLETGEQIAQLQASQAKTDKQIEKNGEQIAQLQASQAKTDKQIEKLQTSQAKTDKQIAKLQASQAKTDKQMEKTQENIDLLMANMAMLTAISVKAHERINQLEERG